MRLPPSPYPLPIIGNIFELGDKPHHSLAALSKTYGPLMSLKLGTTTMIVLSSSEIAQEFFSKHDISFSSRSVPSVARVSAAITTPWFGCPLGTSGDG
ncbi:putative geraniol 8-hydroxylase [Helianthus annuus]|nr:putative geraniol 8-hydroxylase [Helianthus annuus]